MAFTYPPRTWQVGELVTASMMNTHVRDQLDYLLIPEYSFASLDEADKTTTSSTFADVDSGGDPDLSISVTTYGEDIYIAARVSVAVANSGGNINQAVLFDITVDGTRLGADDETGYFKAIAAADATAFPPFLIWRTDGLTAGTHTITLQWKIYAASGTTTATMYCGAGTAGRDVHPKLFVWKA